MMQPTQQPVREMNAQEEENSTDTYTLNVTLGKIQHDTECDKIGSLKYMHNLFLLAE